MIPDVESFGLACLVEVTMVKMVLVLPSFVVSPFVTGGVVLDGGGVGDGWLVVDEVVGGGGGGGGAVVGLGVGVDVGSGGGVVDGGGGGGGSEEVTGGGAVVRGLAGLDSTVSVGGGGVC